MIPQLPYSSSVARQVEPSLLLASAVLSFWKLETPHFTFLVVFLPISIIISYLPLCAVSLFPHDGGILPGFSWQAMTKQLLTAFL